MISYQITATTLQQTGMCYFKGKKLRVFRARSNFAKFYSGNFQKCEFSESSFSQNFLICTSGEFYSREVLYDMEFSNSHSLKSHYFCREKVNSNNLAFLPSRDSFFPRTY